MNRAPSCGSTGARAPVRLRSRRGSFAVFERRFQPIINDDGTLLRGWRDLPRAPDWPRHIWTMIEDGDDNRWSLSPGIRLVNRISFVLCAVPWTDIDLQQPDYLYD